MLTNLVNKEHAPSVKNNGKQFFFQPKLTINQPNDIYEQEADAVADKVVRMSDNNATNKFFSPVSIQRKCAHCDEEERQAQRKENNNNAVEASSQTENYLGSISGGRQLNKEEKSFFEPRLGYDFSDVRLHTDTSANLSAKSINALAYTHGNNIVFRSNQYQPNSENGKRLMAHELTHVVQQNSVGDLKRKVAGEGIDEMEGISAVAGEVIQRDYAVALPNPDATSALTPEQITEATTFNTRVLRNEDEIRMMRDVLGISPDPPQTGDDFSVALADFQLQNNITSDGKLGAVTASRLSRELRAESRFLRRNGGGGQEERLASRRMDMRSLNINVTQAAIERTNTGRAEYRVQWSVPDPRANGWVIQHVVFNGNKRDCAGNAVATNTAAIEYWEGWQVRNGEVFVGGGANRHVADTFGTADEGAGTRGSLTISGHVTFMPGFDLQEPPWGRTPQARDLPTLRVAPPGWSDALARVHRMTVTWDDCAAPTTHSVTTRP